MRPCRKLYGRSIEDAVAGMHNRIDGQGAMDRSEALLDVVRRLAMERPVQ